MRLAWHWYSALGTCITVFNIYKTNDFNIHYHHLYHITTLQWRNLPDTGGPSETYETSRSSEGRVAAGDIGASGDSARHGCSYNNAPLAPLTITRTDDDYSSSLIWITLLHDISTATILWTCMPRMQKDYHTFVSTAEFKVKKSQKNNKRHGQMLSTVITMTGHKSGRCSSSKTRSKKLENSTKVLKLSDCVQHMIR